MKPGNFHPDKESAIPLIPFNVEVLLCRTATLSDWHHTICDPFWRIYYMSNPGWSIVYKNKKLDLKSNQLIVIPAHTPFTTESGRTATQLYIHFNLGTVINPFKPGIYSLPLNDENRQTFHSLLNPLPDSPQNRLIRTLRVKQLCYHALLHMPKESLESRIYPDKIIEAMRLITHSLRNTPDNETLARSLGMNVNAFIRLFHREVGMAPQKWTTEQRVNKAALLLSHTVRTIDDISEETGFFDRNHFTRVFRKQKGIGPGNYRRQASNRM